MQLNGWLLLVLVSVVVAGLMHWRIRHFWVATTLASFVSPVAAVLISAFLDGSFDAFGGVVVLIGLVVSIPLSCLVGAVFESNR